MFNVEPAAGVPPKREPGKRRFFSLAQAGQYEESSDMSRLSRGLDRRLLRMGLSLVGLILVGCSTAGPARDVAYDPFVPSALIKHRKTGAVSVAYRGGVTEVFGRTVVKEEHAKEILVFDD
jgi:hypothetical protein